MIAERERSAPTGPRKPFPAVGVVGALHRMVIYDRSGRSARFDDDRPSESVMKPLAVRSLQHRPIEGAAYGQARQCSKKHGQASAERIQVGLFE